MLRINNIKKEKDGVVILLCQACFSHYDVSQMHHLPTDNLYICCHCINYAENNPVYEGDIDDTHSNDYNRM
tara:strand:+ start:1164 stop:1376 length:213 start_codon:yes stop_codon:yes gene_type:complete